MNHNHICISSQAEPFAGVEAPAQDCPGPAPGVGPTRAITATITIHREQVRGLSDHVRDAQNCFELDHLVPGAPAQLGRQPLVSCVWGREKPLSMNLKQR